MKKCVIVILCTIGLVLLVRNPDLNAQIEIGDCEDGFVYDPFCGDPDDPACCVPEVEVPVTGNGLKVLFVAGLALVVISLWKEPSDDNSLYSSLRKLPKKIRRFF